MERNPWLHALIVLLVIIAGWYLLAEVWALASRFSDIVLVFFLAWVIAFVLNPAAKALSRGFALPHIISVALVYVGLVCLLFAAGIVIIPIITDQLSQLGTNVGGFADQAPGWVNSIQAEFDARHISVDLAAIFRQQDLTTQVERAGSVVISNALGILTGLASAIFSTMLVLILSFYMVADGNRLLAQVSRVVPPHIREESRYFIDCVDRTFGGFIRGQLIQCVIYGLGTAAVMYFAGLGYVLVSSIFAGAVMLIPFVGPVVALVPPLAIAALQGSVATFVIVGVCLVLLQQIVVNVIAPKLLSEAVGLPPLLVILAMLLGAKIAGVVGAIFGVPIAAVAYAMLLTLYRRTRMGEAAVLAHSEDPWFDDSAVAREPAALSWLGRLISRLLVAVAGRGQARDGSH